MGHVEGARGRGRSRAGRGGVMSGRLRLVLALLLLVAASVPSSTLAAMGLGVSSGAAVPCNVGTPPAEAYQTGSFTGDCIFAEGLLGGPYGCVVDRAAGTYTAACLPVDTPPAGGGYYTPEAVPGCDTYKGGWFCPSQHENPTNPAPGYNCEFQQVNGHWVCKTPPPPPEVNCAYVEADGVQACSYEGGGAPPQAAGTAEPCVSQGGVANLICNGDFSDLSGVAGGLGNWQQSASSPCGGLTGYVPDAGGALLIEPFGNGCDPTYAPNGGWSVFLRQAFDRRGYRSFRLSFTVSHSSRRQFGHPGDESVAVRVGLNPYNSTDAAAWDNPWTCTVSGTASGQWVTSNPGVVGNRCSVDYFPPWTENPYYLVFSTNDSYGNEPNAVIIDDVVIVPIGSPDSGMVEGGDPLPGEWGCDYNGTTEFECEPPGPPSGGGQEGGPPLTNCVYDNPSQTYICDGPPPPSPSPNPSASPSASPLFPGRTPTVRGTPNLSATPGPSGIPASTNTVCIDGGASLMDLRAHARVVGCLIEGFQNQIYGIGVAFATGLQFAMDLGRVAVLLGRQIVSLLGAGMAVLGWLFEVVGATFNALWAALQVPPKEITELQGWLLFRQSWAPLEILFNGAGALLWARVLLWVMRQAGMLANG